MAEPALASGKVSDISALMVFINMYVQWNDLGELAPPHVVKWQLETEYGVVLPDATSPSAWKPGVSFYIVGSDEEWERVFAALDKDPYLEERRGK